MGGKIGVNISISWPVVCGPRTPIDLGRGDILICSGIELRMGHRNPGAQKQGFKKLQGFQNKMERL